MILRQRDHSYRQPGVNHEYHVSAEMSNEQVAAVSLHHEYINNNVCIISHDM